MYGGGGSIEFGEAVLGTVTAAAENGDWLFEVGEVTSEDSPEAEGLPSDEVVVRRFTRLGLRGWKHGALAHSLRLCSEPLILFLLLLIA